MGITDASIVQISLWFLGILCALLSGMLVYIWKSVLSNIDEKFLLIRKELDKTDKRQEHLEETKVTKEEFKEQSTQSLRALREAQSQLLKLSEDISAFIYRLPKEFAREDHCKIKHQGLEVLVSEVQRSVLEVLRKLDTTANTLNKIENWRGRVDGKIGTGNYTTKDE